MHICIPARIDGPTGRRYVAASPPYQDNVMAVPLLRTALLAACLAVALPAGAQMYKWTDANGRVQYSDRPPSNQQAQVIGRSGTPAPIAPAKEEAKDADGKTAEDTTAPQTWAQKEQEFRKRRMEAEEERQKQAQLEAEERAKAEDCARTRNYLKAAEDGRRLSRTNDKGEIEYLDDAQIRAEAERTRQELSRHCS